MDFVYLIKQLQEVRHEHLYHCTYANLKLEKECRRGFLTIWTFLCSECGTREKIYSEPGAASCPESFVPPKCDAVNINTAMVNGILATGNNEETVGMNISDNFLVLILSISWQLS